MQIHPINTINRRCLLHLLGAGAVTTAMTACVPISAQSSADQQVNGSKQPNTVAAATIDQNKALARQFVDRINAHDVEGAFALFAADWVHHAVGPGIPEDRESAKAFFAMQFTAFPDLHGTIEEMIAEGDKVVVRQQVAGTNTGSLMGMPATGKQARWMVIDIHRIVAGKFVEHWTSSDDLGMMQQLGLIPPPQGR